MSENEDDRPLTKAAREAIARGNKIIAEFDSHSTGKMNLWTSISDYPVRQYVITAECQHKIKVGITTAIVAHLPVSKYSQHEYLAILMALQKRWGWPVLTHQWPKKLLFNMRNKYGADIIRDDIVRKF